MKIAFHHNIWAQNFLAKATPFEGTVSDVRVQENRKLLYNFRVFFMAGQDFLDPNSVSGFEKIVKE